ncbi:MAG: hypothetical protein OXG43_08615 [Chloroflexi bacterium]|nr:hypothetical protein [Chloroflexota bacterium]
MSQPSIRSSPYGDVQLGAFREVLTYPGRYLNDHCLIRHEGLWHFFGIIGDVTGPGEMHGVEDSLAHATSPDLMQWTVRPPALTATGDWPEEVTCFAPYVIEHDRCFYMLYCVTDAHRTQRICLATSTDLFNWERFAGNPVIVPSVSWAKWPGFGLPSPDEVERMHRDAGGDFLSVARRLGGSYGGCRDPHIIKLDDGTFVAYWVARVQEKFGHNLVGVAASMSHDLFHWQEIGPVFTMKAWPFDEEPTLEVESPCVVPKDGRYWLFFKHGWWTHFVASDSPYDFHGYEPQRLGFCHASEVFHWEEQWWITHCSADSEDFRYRGSNRTRGLFMGHLDWPDGALPRLIAPGEAT